MLRSLRNFSLVLAILSAFIACAGEDSAIEEPIHPDQVDDDPSTSDENGGSLEDSFDSAPPASESDMEEESNSMDVEGTQDGALSEPSAPAMPEAAPSEKGGIISSGVKDKKRCRLIADELERQKCLRSQAK